MTVSVLTPVLDEEAQLPGVLADMLAQRCSGRVEFLFVDGGSRDRSREILEQAARADDRIRVLDNPARRTPQALNIGLRAARGTYVARMDAHTRYPPDYLETGVRRLSRGDVLSASGPQVAIGDGAWSRRVALALSTSAGIGSARFRRSQEAETDVDSGFTGVWRRDVLEAHGGWDERWLNDQDTELAARLRAGGGRIVCVPEMAASYVPRDDLRALARQYGRYGYYRVLTSHRHPATLRRAQLLPSGVVVAAVAAVAAPRAVRPAARAGLTSYGVLLGLTGARLLRSCGARDAASVPVVLAVMHGSYGAGFLLACLRTGLPARAFAGLARRSTTPLPERR